MLFLLLFLLVPIVVVAYMVYHLSRQGPRGWQQFVVATILFSSLPASMAGYAFLEPTVPGLFVGALLGSLSTGLLMVIGRQLYDGVRKQEAD